MTDDDLTPAGYDCVLVRARRRREEWFWMLAGASVGAAMTGAAIVWAAVPAWRMIVVGGLGFLACAVVQQWLGI